MAAIEEEGRVATEEEGLQEATDRDLHRQEGERGGTGIEVSQAAVEVEDQGQGRDHRGAGEPADRLT